MASYFLFWPDAPEYSYKDSSGTDVDVDVLYQGVDVHVLRNGVPTFPLLNQLYVGEITEDAITGEPSLNAVATAAEASSAPLNWITAPQFSLLGMAGVGGGFSVNPGIELGVNQTTGAIVANPLTGSNQLKNLNIKVLVTASEVVSTNPIFTLVRAHVHESLVSTWLTPNTLTIPAGLRTRLSLFAEFSDDVVADISNHPGITWSTPSSNITIPDASKGFFTASFDNVTPANNSTTLNASIDASSPLNSTASPIPATPTTIEIKDSWESPADPMNRPYAEFVTGPGPDIDIVNDVPNYLVIADGCKVGDKSKAIAMINKLVNSTNYMKGPAKSPWNHLRKGINFWLLFIPSTDGALTIDNELVTINLFKQERYRKKFTGTPYSDVFSHNPSLDTWERKWIGTNNGKNYEIIYKETKKTGWYGINEFIETVDGLLQAPTHPAFNFWHRKIADETKNVSDTSRYNTTTYAALTPGNLLSDMINQVGLPTKYDKALSNAALVLKWQTVNNSAITASTFNTHVITIWKQLADRRLPNKLNTALGTKFGIAPRVDRSFNELKNPERSPGYGRIDREFLDHLFKDLKLGSDPASPVTNVWRDLNNLPYTDGWAKTASDLGKDFGNILVIGARTRFGGVQIHSEDENTGEFIGYGIFANLEDDAFLYPTQTGNQLNLKQFSYPNTLNTTAYGVISHEMAHSFNLGDEYGAVKVNKQPATPKELNVPKFKSYNLMYEKDALVSELDGSGNSLEDIGEIDGDKVKWRWLRIANAGVLKGVPTENTVTAGHYDVVLNTGHDSHFRVLDFVYLRRPGIESVDISNQLPTPHYSTKLQIVSIDPTTKVITLSDLSNPTNFPKKSILFSPVHSKVVGKGKITGTTSSDSITGSNTFFEVQVNKKTTGTTTGGSFIRIKKADGSYESRRVANVTSNTGLKIDNSVDGNFSENFSNRTYEIIQRDLGSSAPKEETYKELLNYAIRHAISKNKKPMTKYPFTAVDGAIDGGVSQKEEGSQLMVNGAKNIFKLTSIKKGDNRHIVGLYRNGKDFANGIFHPVGYCHMRNNVDALDVVPDTVSGFTQKRNISMFCAVCRYVLVDKIDPSKHKDINDDSKSYFPEI